ncbi:MAG TPA: fumarylacetoacetate hydrolase family protein [Gaiellaceae bacterium]|jgi:fumarylacetoacetase|nr:fumarylacetoacetate hydrolase family protein [Gaiellaceae bacterium]
MTTGFGALAAGGLAWSEGDEAVELRGLGDVFAEPTLNPLLALGPAGWAQATDAARVHDGPRGGVQDARMRLPFEVADYVDFYSSREHASNLGRILRPDQEPLLPNWRWLPIGYHGRAGTVAVSGTEVVRPHGQVKPAEGDPVFGPTNRLDVELELGFVVGVPSMSGDQVAVEAFADHVFGVVLVNDWSARDLQAWEYRPLGPFLGKSFQTSISAWVTPLALLEPRLVAAPAQEPPPLPYLAGGRDWGLDLDLELELNGEVVSRTNARGLYWTMPQQLAHVTSNGASLRTGDLMATGAISGSERGSEGSLIELWESGRFLADGDEVVLRGSGGKVELGEVRGRIVSRPSNREG